jgi:amino acid adenylation domain-containing protein/non-ribosomal peptide synthase protein (TIGR01720 family)
MDKRIVHHVFEQTAAHFPENIAVEHAGCRLDYARLNQEAETLAQVLRSNPVDPQVPVGIFMPSGLDYLISILGIAKAGGIFMPLAVDFPRQRLITILMHTQPQVILTDIDHVDLLKQLCTGSFPDATIRVVSFREEAPLAVFSPDHIPGMPIQAGGVTHRPTDPHIADPSTADSPVYRPGPDDGLYVMHTSGSTGIPKAILGSHKGLSHFVHWEIREFGLTPDLRVSLLAPPTFDVSLRDIFVPLMVGGTVCIPDPETRNHSNRLLDWLGQAGITLMHCTPSVFRLLMAELEMRHSANPLPALQRILLAGEPLYGEDVNRWQSIMGNRVELVNLYGPTETTLAKLYHRIAFQTYDREQIIPLGLPISNTAVLILKDNRLCAIGEKGDIYIKTPFRTKGYYLDSELTAQRFVQNPLNPDAEDIIYRTGDQGRYRPDRSVEFIGREDDQIKRHGIRVEPAEIEKALRSHAAVAETLIATRAGRGDHRDILLLAYFTEKQPVSPSELRVHLQDLLPEYMIPDFFIAMDAFPRNAHGKTDRSTLPLPAAIPCGSLPDTDTEIRLAAIWQEVLGTPVVGKTDSFFDVGGNSLNAMRILARIYHEMGREITLKSFFTHPRLQDLASLIDGSPSITYQPIERVPETPEQTNFWPLSAAQHRLWVLHQMQGGETVYNIPIAYACRGPFDPDRWAHALESMVCRHEAFRTCFILQSDQPRQQILPSVSVPVEVVDLSAAPDPLAACKNRVQSLASTLFDLTQAPLLRAAVYKIGCEHHVLALVVHHIISDAWSMDILARETAVFYAASPHIPDMPPLPCRYPDYTLWQKRLLNSPKMKAQSDYWRRQLAGDPSALDLPIDFIRPAVQTFTGGAVEFTLNEALTEKLSDLGKNHQASLFMVVQALIKILLFRYSGQVELRIGAPVSGRIHPDISGLIGCFVNMLVLRDTIQPHQSASDLLNQVRHTTTEALAHQDYPFDQLVNELVLDRDISRNPLVDVGLTFYEADPVITSGKELVLTPFAFDWPVSKMDLIFTFRPAGKTLQGEARFRSDLFQPDTIHRMIAHLKILIHSVRENPATPIADLTILPDSEKKLILDEFVSEKRGQVSGNREQEPTLPPLFIQIDQIAGQSPDKPAVVCEDRSIGYRELNRMSDDLARYLRRRGVDAGMPVAVLLHRSPSWVMAMIGVMKAGGVYLPIDPQYPESRIQFMLEDSGCRLLITDTSLWAFSSAFDTLQRVNLDAGLDAELDAGLDDGCFASSDVGIIPEIMPDQTAYMIYTSGSTGVPKGVMVPHRGPVNMAMDQIRRFGIRESDRLLQFSSPGFDASIYEMYLTFFSGATLVIVPPADIQDPERFIRYLADQQVTLATLPPVYLGTLNRALPECVHTVITAGEAAMASDAVYYGSRIQYINAYGPTETSVCAACHRVSPDHSYPLGIPIGRPLSGLRIFILDSRLQPVPIGIPGEICISGIGLAHGYHNRPELTEQAFVPHPFEPGNRLYRSGDVGKWLPDGDILFLGRKDDQVKIRGHRIEIQEIVLMLRHQPGIRDAVVFSHPNPGGRELTAYCIPETRTDNDGLAESALKQALGRQLPAFMVPSRIVFLERFPLTANGKIDRRALPDPMQEAVCSDVQPPLEGMAGLLTQIWCHVLGREAVGLHDNFFALGGDSIKAIQVSARLHENHLHLQVADLYRFPTIDELLGHIQAANPDNTSGPAWGQTPLTPIQRWFFENFADHCHHFNQAVLLEPALPLNPAILKIALRSVIDHHDALRSRFSRNTDGWVQTIDPPGMEMEVEVVVLDGSRQSDAADLIRNHAAEVQAGFDISRPPLIRVVWYRLGNRERLLIVCHHLVVDTVSWRILLEDMEAAYRSGLQGQSAVLPAKTIGMKQWAESLQAYASDPNLTADIPFWKSQLSDSGNQPRYLRHTCRDVQTARFHLSDFETEALLNQGQRVYQASAQELLLAGLATAFRHWQGYNRLCLALEHHGREVGIMPAEPLRTVGWFTSLYPVIFPVETEPGAQIRSIQRHLHEIPGQGLGFGVLRYSGTDKIREELNTGNWPAISFNYLGRLEPATPQSFFREVPEPVGPLVAPDAVRLHDLDIQAWIYQNTLHASIYFHPDQISEDRVQSLLNFYRQALTDMSLHCTDRSPDVLSTDSRFYGLSDLDLEKALGDD